VIATQDAQHLDHAMAAMVKGYDLLLEKPISNRLENCIALAKKAKELGRTVLVCHVLRYSPFYRAVKDLVMQGVAGKIETVHACEDVGYYHIAHSYVRGNWHNSETSSPMILAKCSHDMDLLLWLTGRDCRKVTSFGSLDHFKLENAPEGSTERCRDCKVDCPYNAQNFYLSRMPGWPTHVLHPEPTEENILKALDETDYGRCVYRMDNNVVDHQTLNLLFDDGITATFQMNGFNNIQNRRIRIQGTKGEIWGDFRGRLVYWQQYNNPEVHTVDLNETCTDFTGHGGGDNGLVYDAIRYFRGDDFDTTSVTTIERSVESHIMAFAAEDSRLRGGELVKIDDFKKQHNA